MLAQKKLWLPEFFQAGNSTLSTTALRALSPFDGYTQIFNFATAFELFSYKPPV